MYKTKVFDTFYDLITFLNANKIVKADIISISTFSRGVALIYFDSNIEE